jgi:hypothetical protein
MDDARCEVRDSEALRTAAVRTCRGLVSPAMFRAACAVGLEGIASKRRSALLLWLSPDWIKVKNPDAPAATHVGPGVLADVLARLPDLSAKGSPSSCLRIGIASTHQRAAA